MRTYESLFILRPDLEAEQIAAQVEKLSQVVQQNGGEMVKVDQWGKRRLAYEVKDFKEGYYVLFHFQGQPATESELERIFKLSEEVIRFLITRLDVA